MDVAFEPGVFCHGLSLSQHRLFTAAGHLPPLKIEGIAVAVARWCAKGGDVAILVQPAQLHVVGDVAPEQVTANAVPRRPFRPERAAVEAFDDGIANLVAVKALIQGDDVGVGIPD